MKTKRALVAIGLATIAFAVLFVLPIWVPIPVLFYKPAEHAWVVDVKVSGIGMDFYGRCLVAVAVAGVVGGAAYLVSLRLRPPTSRAIAITAGVAIAVTVAVMIGCSWTLGRRTLTPPVIPSGTLGSAERR